MVANWLLAVLIAVIACCPVWRTNADSTNATGDDLLPELHVSGNDIVNNKGGKVWLRGVNVASLEWSADGQGKILTTVRTAIRDWKVNIVRIPLTQDRWFGKTPGQNDEGLGYKNLVGRIVELCETNHCYVILDLHWSDCNDWGRNIGQHSMPDRNSLAFWKDFAAVYANNPAVIFDLYNEPHDVSWEVWRNGGSITDKPNTRRSDPPKTFDCVGMQQLLDAVRATGAKNMVIAGVLGWASDFSGILKDGGLSDPKGNGVVYADHCYDNRDETAYQWIAEMEAASARFPIIVSEFGGRSGPGRKMPSENWLLHVMVALHEHRWSWVAWDLHPGAGPTLISDWNYTPTEQFGVYVKRMLCENKAPDYTPPGPEQPEGQQ